MGHEEGCVSYQEDPEQFRGCDGLSYWNGPDEDIAEYLDKEGECGTCKYGLKNIIRLIKKGEELECVGPIPDLPDYSPRHNSLDAGDEDGVIAQMISQNLVEKTWSRLYG